MNQTFSRLLVLSIALGGLLMSSPALAASIPNPCAAVIAKPGSTLKTSALPLLPKELFTPNIIPSPAPTPAPGAPPAAVTPAPKVTPQCNPTYWTRQVYNVIALRILNLLNWTAGSLAVVITVYAGTLYVMGFMNEANVKKAKSLLITAYTGLAIVFLSRAILYGTVAVITGDDVNPTSPYNVDLTL